MNSKEEQLAIKEGNQRIFEKNMVFNIRLSMANFDSERPNRNCILLADTLLISGEDVIETLTKSITKHDSL